MKKGIYIIFAMCLLLTAGWYLLSEREYTHKELVSQLPQTQCCLCGEQGEQTLRYDSQEGNVGILNLNTWDLVCVDLKPQDNEQQTKDFQMEVGMQANDGTVVETTSYPNRGYAYGTIRGCKYQLNRDFVQSRLCQACLNRINDTNFGGEAPAEYAIVNFTEKTVWIVAQGTSWIYTGDYKIGCAFEEDGTIKLLIHDRQI